MLESFQLNGTFCFDPNIIYGIEIRENIGEQEKRHALVMTFMISTIEVKRTEHTQPYRARIQTIYSGLMLMSDNFIC